MKISKNTINWLNDNYSYTLYDSKGFETNSFAKATEIYVGFESFSKNEDPIAIAKSIKTPKSKEVTVDWISSKINKDLQYNGLVDKFRSIVKQSMNIYATSYGIGIYMVGANTKTDKQAVENALNQLGIAYRTEKSEAGYVHRYIISKTKQNLSRI